MVDYLARTQRAGRIRRRACVRENDLGRWIDCRVARIGIGTRQRHKRTIHRSETAAARDVPRDTTPELLEDQRSVVNDIAVSLAAIGALSAELQGACVDVNGSAKSNAALQFKRTLRYLFQLRAAEDLAREIPFFDHQRMRRTVADIHGSIALEVFDLSCGALKIQSAVQRHIGRCGLSRDGAQDVMPQGIRQRAPRDRQRPCGSNGNRCIRQFHNAFVSGKTKLRRALQVDPTCNGQLAELIHGNSADGVRTKNQHLLRS
ncbi:hypothetical protein [Achromobacter spanius]|uniref:hypothetical protein n=1 Tax=Achromobacter spanius TaxID=217203 RepID=UPI003F68E875